MNVKIEPSWKNALDHKFKENFFKELVAFIKGEYQAKMIFLPGKDIFNAFNFCPLNQVKVVILGQDPYHGPGQAHGLSFSVKPGIPFPPSLLNIFKEIKTDLSIDISPNVDLKRWENQGVFLFKV